MDWTGQPRRLQIEQISSWMFRLFNRDYRPSSGNCKHQLRWEDFDLTIGSKDRLV